ncbi:GAP family protein [Arthrobacter psychrolactophilus]|nr:GAP family protein [Arthrobacter psychrolactophilus]
MTIAVYVQLAILALIDSTSIGTLLIPFWLLLRPNAKHLTARILLYLGVLAGFYFLVGIAVLSGADAVIRGMGEVSLTDLPVIQWIMVLAGGGMLSYALMSNPQQKDKNSQTATDAPAVEMRWRDRLSKALHRPGGVVGLALLAGLLELPTMLPYLVAIGFLTNSTLALHGEIAVLLIYCFVMFLPALLLLVFRGVLGHRLDTPLQRLNTYLGAIAGETVLWVVGIVGFLLLRAGLSEMAPLAVWNPFK